jgi:thiol-disulfide isomerase/thioredoxin
MQKKVIIFILLLFTFQRGNTQKITSLTVILDETIDPKKTYCSYYDGKNTILITDTFTNRVLTIKNKFYSSFISFHIEYKTSSSTSYVNDFFVDNKPSKIIFHFSPNDQDNILKYKKIVNATPIYDTSTNKLFKKLVLYRKKEAKEVSDLWEKHGSEINSTDSFSLLNQKLFKSLNIRTLSFLKNYSQNYFSFWYFRTQVLETSLTFLTKDISYLKSLLTSLNSTFPKKYIESFEGQAMIKRLNGIINPVIVNKQAPSFIISDINGNKIKLNDFKNKYVLLDFWATWCLPCMLEMPFLKKIRNDFPEEKLVIIGVNKDKNVTILQEAVIKNAINWVHIFDQENKIQNLFGVISFPTTILINKDGVVVYNSSEREDKEELIRLLKNM